MDFKWEMQERIDAGMNPDQAYNATRDSYASTWDNRDKFDRNCRCDCNCTCDGDCECKNPDLTSSQINADLDRYGKIAGWR